MRHLIAQLASDDPALQRRAGDALLAAGSAAAPALLEALASDTPAIRKSAAFLLGHQRGDRRAVEALRRAVLHDLEPKVRKNAAVALGKLADPSAADELAEALRREQIAWVRPSLILALGAVGGDAAIAALAEHAPDSAPEREALHKALERLRPERATAEWNRGARWTLQLLAEAPVGLEAVAAAEARARGITLDPVAPGLLRVAGAAPWDLLPALRCIYGLRIDAGRDEPLDPDDPRQCAVVTERLVANSPPLRDLRRWLAASEEPVRFRFAFDRPTRKELLLAMLEGVRRGADRHGMVDSPSNYALEVLIDTDESGTSCSVRPSFFKDTRFDYRERDVPAAINPVVAACLARLVRTGGRGLAFDPTCGSATLLIERALLDDGVTLAGLDNSREAVQAAEANIRAAGLERRVSVRHGDAADLRAWPQCDEVLANLPFGLRTRRDAQNLEALYRAVVENLADRLEPGGRALLYSTNRRAVERLLAAERSALRLEHAYEVLSGGLWVGAWLASARGAAGLERGAGAERP